MVNALKLMTDNCPCLGIGRKHVALYGYPTINRDDGKCTEIDVR